MDASEFSQPILAEQLLLDERFIAWAEGVGDLESMAWIETLRNRSDEQQEQVLEAWMIYRSIRWEEAEVSGSIEQRDRLMARLNRESVPKALRHRGRQRLWLLPAISMFALLLGLFVLFYKAPSSTPTVLSGNGKLSKLADGTAVTLKKNSTITYVEGFEKKDVREVWVKGEAHFSVARKKEDQPFVVHTGFFDIQVTGTRFIVSSDPGQASVLLQEGSVNLIFPSGEIARMKPGDYFSLASSPSVPKNGSAQATPVALERHIVFDNTPFVQVAQEIERRYQVQVKILDPVLNEKLITGILPNNDLEALLSALASAMDCRITKEAQIIFIKSSL